MSHEFDAGFFVREPAWHGLGTVVAEYPANREEARRLAEMEWDPFMADVFNADGTKIEGFKQVQRGEGGNTLAITPKSYTPVDNGVLYDIAEGILDAGKKKGRKVNYETCIQLDEGRRIVILCKLGEHDLPGDPSLHRQYLYVASSHDRSAALRAGCTNVRIVCANTEALADTGAIKDGLVCTFKHTSNIMARVEEAKLALTGAYAQMDALKEHSIELLRTKVNAAQEQKFCTEWAIQRTLDNMNVPKAARKGRLDDKAVVTRVNATVDELVAILNSQTSLGIRGTAYALTQAAVEYMDHVREVKGGQESIFTRSMLDRPSLKRHAHELVASL